MPPGTHRPREKLRVHGALSGGCCEEGVKSDERAPCGSERALVEQKWAGGVRKLGPRLGRIGPMRSGKLFFIFIFLFSFYIYIQFQMDFK
jgi:hypothetical protein